MSKPSKKEMRLNFTLTPELSERLEKYCLRVAVEKGKVSWGIKGVIGRRAIDTWLTLYENSLIDFDDPYSGLPIQIEFEDKTQYKKKDKCVRV